jgi:hypothetical protein
MSGCLRIRRPDVPEYATGAINTAHNRYLNPEIQINSGKKLLINKLSSMLGWDDLCYDTFPSEDFNIWHFPEEYRATPATKHINYSSSIPYITAEELLKTSNT